MKFKILLLAVLSLGFFLNSCEDDNAIITVSETNPISLSELSVSMIELDPNNPANPAVTFNWEEADYGFPASENYDVIMASDASFTNPVVATSAAGATSATLSMNELNTIAGTVGIPPFEFNTLYAKVESSIGTQNGLPVSSNAIMFSVQPYFNYDFKDYFLVGNGTAADWNNNNNNPPLFRDAENIDLYTYTGLFTKGGGGFTDGRFKLLEARGMWQPQWGTTLSEPDDLIETSGEIAGNPTTQDSDPGRFGVTADGYYKFTVNFSSFTYSIEPYDASGATEFSSMTLQGSALTEDAVMMQLPFDSHIWYVNSINLAPGDVSFTTNTGASWGSDSSFSGSATEGGNAIPVIVQDDYEVWFNDLTGDYIMIPLNL
ncbi:SusE domain-containing protein [Sediminibacter sp. Hel_I_10]|uniref:SusE domain-containing protein n=1 Tax=Sediminibacter sp. Hel_I_10 TaxID=1392490 RepID=UPI0012DC59F8|nr:SusE domain-containing protein [Sediminibacter sp. Hel_I_10]